MNENLIQESEKLYKQFAMPSADALKKIGAGRLKGKSDINPQWRIECLTKMFGLCGFGWYTKITNKEIKDGADGEKVAIVDIELYIKNGDQWSAPIVGTGGSMLVEIEKNGLYTSDEAYKMAYTDALSVCCKMIGIASDVYRGKVDGGSVNDSKYDYERQSKSDFSELRTKEDFLKAIHECTSVKQLNALYYRWKDTPFYSELNKASSDRKLALQNPDAGVQERNATVEQQKQ